MKTFADGLITVFFLNILMQMSGQERVRFIIFMVVIFIVIIIVITVIIPIAFIIITFFIFIIITVMVDLTLTNICHCYPCPLSLLQTFI